MLKNPTSSTQPHSSAASLSLHQAITEKDPSQVNLLLSQGINLESKDSRGVTAFLLAAQTGQLELLKTLGAAQANFKATTLDGQTALHLAAIGGQVEVVVWLWEQGLDPLQKDGMGQQVLHCAVHHGRVAVVKQVLSLATPIQTNALVQGQDNDGKTPLHYAGFQPDPEVVRLLVKAGAEVNAPNRYGYTPLHFAARSGQLALLEVLLEYKAEARLNVNGDYPIHLALHFGQAVWAERWFASQRQGIGVTLPEKVKTSLEKADVNFVKAKTLDELNQVAASYTQTLSEAEESQAWLVVVYIALQLSEVELRKALFLNQLSQDSKDPHQRADFERRSLQCYAKAAKYASTAEVLLQQKGLAEKNNATTENTKTLTGFTALHPLDQQHRIQRRFVQDILGRRETSLELPVVSSRLHRETLRQLREQARQGLDNNAYTTEFLLHRVTQGFISLTQNLLKPCFALLGPPPCRYAFLGLGSMARGEMSPYSDLECAIVIEKDTPENKEYFRQLTRLLELQMITLNETKFPLLKKGLHSPIPPGFSFDSGGNTPLGKEGLFELIATPEQLATFQQMQWFEQELITSNVLKTVCHLTGDATLTEQYEVAVKKVLDGETPTSSTTLSKPTGLKGLLMKLKLKKPPMIRQQQALQLLTGDIAEYGPQLGAKKEHQGYFDVKQELYRLPSSILQELSLFYGLSEKGTFARLKALQQKGYFSEGGVKQLTRLFEQVLRYRLKAHLFYEREKESLYHPELLPSSVEESTGTSTTESERRLELTTDQLDQLVEFHKVLLPLERVAKAFCESNGQVKSFWDEKTFYDDSLLAQGIILENQLQYHKAKACYEDALALNPNDIDALHYLGNLKDQLGETDGRLARLQKALDLALTLKGAEHPDVATSYNNLGNAYWALGQFKESLSCQQQALAINIKVYGESHPDVATSYNNLGNAYYALVQFKEALSYYQQALAIFL
jgi:ankyrin repeat protein